MKALKIGLIGMLIPFLVIACGGGGDSSPTPTPISVEKTPAEGIWDAGYNAFNVTEDDADETERADPVNIQQADAAELLVTPEGRIFLRDPNNHNAVAVGSMQKVSENDQSAKYNGTLQFFAERVIYSEDPSAISLVIASANVEATVTSSRQMTMRVSFIHEPNAEVVIRAEYNDAKYAQQPDFKTLAGQYVMRQGMLDLSWNYGIDNLNIHEDGTFRGLLTYWLGDTWSGQLTIPHTGKNIYAFENAPYHRANTDYTTFMNGVGYVSGDRLILFSITADPTGRSYAPLTLTPLPSTLDEGTNQHFYEGQWDLTLVDDPTGNSGALKRRVIVLENGVTAVLTECAIEAGTLSTFVDGTVNYQNSFSEYVCPADEITYFRRSPNITIDRQTGVMTLIEDIMIKDPNAITRYEPVTWRGTRNNQYNQPPRSPVGNYTDFSKSNDNILKPISVEDDNTFIYDSVGGFRATITASPDKHYYTIDSDYTVFAPDISGYAIPTDFYGSEYLIVWFFGHSTSSDTKREVHEFWQRTE